MARKSLRDASRTMSWIPNWYAAGSLVRGAFLGSSSELGPSIFPTSYTVTLNPSAEVKFSDLRTNETARAPRLLYTPIIDIDSFVARKTDRIPKVIPSNGVMVSSFRSKEFGDHSPVGRVGIVLDATLVVAVGHWIVVCEQACRLPYFSESRQRLRKILSLCFCFILTVSVLNQQN